MQVNTQPLWPLEAPEICTGSSGRASQVELDCIGHFVQGDVAYPERRVGFLTMGETRGQEGKAAIGETTAQEEPLLNDCTSARIVSSHECEAHPIKAPIGSTEGKITIQLPQSRASQEHRSESYDIPLLWENVPILIDETSANVDSRRTVARENLNERLQRKNVLLTLGVTSTLTLFLACGQGPVFDMYIFILGNKSNRWVGDTESISGIVALLVAAPVGILVDKFNRGKICKTACIVGILGTATSLCALTKDCIPVIVVSLVEWGIFWELSNSATNAIFTDSLRRGDRTEWFTRKGMVRNASWAVAPLVMAGFFLAYGDEWDLGHVRLLLFVGTTVFGPLCSVLLWFFIDVPKDSQIPEGEGVTLTGDPHTNSGRRLSEEQLSHIAEGALGDGDTEVIVVCREGSRGSAGGTHGVSGDIHLQSSSSASPAGGPERPQASQLVHINSFAGDSFDGNDSSLYALSRLHRSIPFIVSIADFVRAMGAGMTVKFFPLFFCNEYKMTPVQLCEVGVLYAFSIVIFIYVAKRLAVHTGRAMATQILSLLGLLMLVSMCVLQDLRLLIVAHLIRGGMQNANYPIDRSIVMDFTARKDRGKWSAVETLTSTMWSGSAFIGGIMADNNYRLAFAVTAAVYAIAWLISLPLVFIVPDAEKELGICQHASTTVGETQAVVQTVRSSRVIPEAVTSPRSASHAAFIKNTDTFDLSLLNQDYEMDTLPHITGSEHSTALPISPPPSALESYKDFQWEPNVAGYA